MDALILAGGLGTRLRTKVSDRPKVMALINERPFLDYLFDQLISADIKRVILSTGYMSSYIQSHYGEHYKHLNIIYSEENERLGTGGAIKYALPHIQTDELLVMNGDSYCGVSLKGVLSQFNECDKKIGMVLNYQSDISRYGSVKCDGRTVFQFLEKTGVPEEGWINAGIYILPRYGIASIDDGNVSLERDVFPKWVDDGIYGYKSEDRFIDIGTPESYEEAQLFFKTLENAL